MYVCTMEKNILKNFLNKNFPKKTLGKNCPEKKISEKNVPETKIAGPEGLNCCSRRLQPSAGARKIPPVGRHFF